MEPTFGISDEGATLRLEISLPGTTLAEVDAGFVDANTFELEVPSKFYLRTQLPRPIDDEAQTATFDKATGVLVITVRVLDEVIVDETAEEAVAAEEAKKAAADKAAADKAAADRAAADKAAADKAANVKAAAPSRAARIASAVSTATSELSAGDYASIDSFLTPDECAELILEIEGLSDAGRLQLGKVEGSAAARELRGDEIAWIGPGEAGAAIRRVQQMAAGVVDGLCAAKGIKALRKKELVQEETMVARYAGNGARYAKHCDTMAQAQRVLTLIVYPNQDWREEHGGALRLHVPAGAVDIAPSEGRMVLFWADSRVPHEVLPAKRTRYAATTWFMSDAPDFVAPADDHRVLPAGWVAYADRCRATYKSHKKKVRAGLEVCLDRIATNAVAVGEMDTFDWSKMQAPDVNTINMFS